MAKRVVILTGDELRHRYFRKRMAADGRFAVVASYCESDAKSLRARVDADDDASWLQQQHVRAREQAERDFFEEVVAQLPDASHPVSIEKGGINDEAVVREIEAQNADLLVCYGSSLVKSCLVSNYAGRFINVHLGLSPYYRGSGTNVFPIINGELGLVGATFMYLDEGVDTGKIIHQIRADVFVGDSPHSIGNRLIRKMTGVYADLVARAEMLEETTPVDADGKLYLQKQFTNDACALLYDRIRQGAVEKYLRGEDRSGEVPLVVNGALLS